MVKVCFVCLGNICRSPTAEGIMNVFVQEANLQHKIKVDSAGTSAFHEGEPADPRSQKAANQRGYELTSRARAFRKSDISQFDYIVAMDTTNRNEILKMCSSDHQKEKLHLLRDFDPKSSPESSVPDPYYGGANGFSEVLNICERGCQGLLQTIRADKSYG